MQLLITGLFFLAALRGSSPDGSQLLITATNLLMTVSVVGCFLVTLFRPLKETPLRPLAFVQYLATAFVTFAFVVTALTALFTVGPERSGLTVLAIIAGLSIGQALPVAFAYASYRVEGK